MQLFVAVLFVVLFLVVLFLAVLLDTFLVAAGFRFGLSSVVTRSLPHSLYMYVLLIHLLTGAYQRELVR